jgi:hypothetical protein
MQIQDLARVIVNPAKAFMFRVTIPSLPIKSIQVQSAQFPGVSVSDMELWHMGQKMLLPGAKEYDHTWQCTIAESEDGAVFNPIYAWHQLLAHSETGVQESSDDYLRDVIISPLTGAHTPWLECVLKMAYPKTIDPVELDASANTEVYKWVLTFNYSWWKPV